MTQRSVLAPLDESTTDEIEAADILLHLPQLCFESESRRRFPSWAAKRRRSLGRDPMQSFLCFRLLCSSSSEFPRETVVGAVGPKCEKEGAPAVKDEASSPVTPLSFSLSSESDEKPKQSLKRKLPLKRREDWLEIIDELTQRRDSLKGEMEYMSRYCTYLKASNLEMKAKLSLGPFLKTVNSLGAENQDTDRTVQMHSSLPSSCGFGMVSDNVSPSGLPDLNVSAEGTVTTDSSGPFDLNATNKNIGRVMAAQARQRRMQIYKAKKLHCH